MLNYNYRNDVSFVPSTMLIDNNNKSEENILCREAGMISRGLEIMMKIVSRSSHKYDVKANMLRSTYHVRIVFSSSTFLWDCSPEFSQWQAICCLHIMYNRRYTRRTTKTTPMTAKYAIKIIIIKLHCIHPIHISIMSTMWTPHKCFPIEELLISYQ